MKKNLVGPLRKCQRIVVSMTSLIREPAKNTKQSTFYPRFPHKPCTAHSQFPAFTEASPTKNCAAAQLPGVRRNPNALSPSRSLRLAPSLAPERARRAWAGCTEMKRRNRFAWLITDRASGNNPTRPDRTGTSCFAGGASGQTMCTLARQKKHFRWSEVTSPTPLHLRPTRAKPPPRQ